MPQNHFTLALITGASSGIGQELCRLLANQGIPLLIHGRNRENLDKLAAELNQKVTVKIIQADLSIPSQQELVIEAIHQNKPDLVINNAGFGLYGDLLSYPTEEQLEILQVDGYALAKITIEAARTLKAEAREGVIMNISSAAAFPIFPGFAIYSATKAFVNQFSESFDEETKKYGVRVLVACPGVVETEFRKNARGKKLSGEKMMRADFAASQIWQQIVKRKKMRIFNWTYRLSIFFVRYLLPKSLVAKLVERQIQKLHVEGNSES